MSELRADQLLVDRGLAESRAKAQALIRRLLTTHEVAVTVEEASIGGFGAHVLTLASDEGLADGGLKLRTLRFPDRFQDQDKPEKQIARSRPRRRRHRRRGAEGAEA